MTCFKIWDRFLRKYLSWWISSLNQPSLKFLRIVNLSNHASSREDVVCPTIYCHNHRGRLGVETKSCNLEVCTFYFISLTTQAYDFGIHGHRKYVYKRRIRQDGVNMYDCFGVETTNTRSELHTLNSKKLYKIDPCHLSTLSFNK